MSLRCICKILISLRPKYQQS
uniref:Uncharacterized protein n=1 Tax=Rhizophora mucronata TaxID=61149 RepID=A0A2P2MDU0_RHIMU